MKELSFSLFRFFFSRSHSFVAASRSPYSVLNNFRKGPSFTFSYSLHSHNLCGDIFFSVFSVFSLIFLAERASEQDRDRESSLKSKSSCTRVCNFALRCIPRPVDLFLTWPDALKRN